MTYPLPTDTEHVSIEGRQYRLFNFDLGEGLSRRSMLVVSLIVVPWWVLMGLIGVPVLNGSPLYLFPPAVVAALALRVDDGERPRWALWLDRVRWWVRKKQVLVPKVGGGEGIARPFMVQARWHVLDVAAIERRVEKQERKRRGGSR